MVSEFDTHTKNQNNEVLINLLYSKEPLSYGPIIGKRHIQIALVFCIALMNYAIRISMSVLIVAMTDPTSTENPNIPIYDWTDKSIVMSSFLWGYMIPQIGAGYLATTYGAKWFLAGTILVSSSVGFLIPLVAANFGSAGVIGIRFIQGLSQGFLFPSTHALLSKWVPLDERSRLGTFPYLGPPVGTVGTMLLTGWISSTWYGWPMAVYIFNGVGLCVGVMFACFGCSEPDQHSSITEEERTYIKNNLSTSKEKQDIPVPWKDIFTSVPVYAVIIAQTGWSWSNWILLLETPIYMNHVMKFDLKSNGALSSLPYVAEATFALVYSIIADFLIVRNIFSISVTRKTMNFIGILLPAIALIILANCDVDDAYTAVILLVLIGVTGSATRSGYNVNHIDLAPNFAGILMGITNGTSAAVASLGPLVIQLLVTNENDPGQWQLIFYIAAAVSIVSCIFNLLFASGTVQPWNEGSRTYKEKMVQKA